MARAALPILAAPLNPIVISPLQVLNHQSQLNKRKKSKPFQNPVVGAGDQVPAVDLKSLKIKRWKVKKNRRGVEELPRLEEEVALAEVLVAEVLEIKWE